MWGHELRVWTKLLEHEDQWSHWSASGLQESQELIYLPAVKVAANLTKLRVIGGMFSVDSSFWLMYMYDNCID